MQQQDFQAIAELAADSCAFNDISGASKEITQQAFLEQLDYLVEEVREIQEGIETKNKVEILDGIVDTLVVTFGMLQKLKNTYDCNIVEACNRIGINNLSKYPVDQDTVHQTQDMYDAKGVDTYWTFNDEYQVFVIRDKEKNKVKKPYGFVPVDLTDCFPTSQ